jgi:hypothetical protein
MSGEQKQSEQSARMSCRTKAMGTSIGRAICVWGGKYRQEERPEQAAAEKAREPSPEATWKGQRWQRKIWPEPFSRQPFPEKGAADNRFPSVFCRCSYAALNYLYTTAETNKSEEYFYLI